MASDLFRSAVGHHQAGAFSEAERAYRHILSLQPDHADALHNLGLIVLQKGNAPSAVALLERAIELHRDNAEYHHSIALAWRSMARLDKAAAHLEQAIKIRPDHALAHFNLGNLRSEQRQWAEAIGHYKVAVVREPSRAELHHRLGLALMAEGRFTDAVTAFERAVACNARLPGVHDDLAAALMAAGRLEPAFDAAARAVELTDCLRSRAAFADCARFARFSSDNGRFRRLLTRALSEAWGRPRDLAAVCLSLIKVSPAVRESIAGINAAWPSRLSSAELGPTKLAALARDELLRGMLENDPLSDADLERLITTVRSIMLTAAFANEPKDEQLLAFWCAVARQCFVNDYVFSLTEAEAGQAQRLRTDLEQALAGGGAYPDLWIIVVGCYYPLHTLQNADVLLQREVPLYLKAVLTQQVEEPSQELRIAATIPILSQISDGVSHAVRQQYEQSPYPRWARTALPEKIFIPDGQRAPRGMDVLIAGCGTGLSSIEFARQNSSAHVLAIDLSIASLSYAKRMAALFELTNLEFGQADIMQLGAITKTFDAIESSGVLHHLEDPWRGWQILLSVLRPGGIMQVGLYSAAARENVVAARRLIAERGYRPLPQEIRRCREEILGSNDPVLRSVTQWQDFFTINECRDLLFNVQEHRVSLPEIKTFIAANDLEFAGFLLDAATLHRFATRFPDRNAMLDLDCWHIFETELPHTFSGMYQFNVRKLPLDRAPDFPSDQAAPRAQVG